MQKTAIRARATKLRATFDPIAQGIGRGWVELSNEREARHAEWPVHHLQQWIFLELIHEIFHAHLICLVGAVDLVISYYHAVVQEDEAARCEKTLEGAEVESRLLLRVVSVNENQPDLAKRAIRIGFHELLRREWKVTHVVDAVRGEVSHDLVGIRPERVGKGRIDECHDAWLEIILERLGEHERNEAPVRSDDDHLTRADHSSHRIVKPSEPEIEILCPLTMPHAEQIGLFEELRDPLFHDASLCAHQRATRSAMSHPGEAASERERAAKLLHDSLTGNWTTQAICVAAELGLADELASRGLTSKELAAVTGTHEPSLRRLLRALIALDVLRAGPNESFELASMGSMLRSDSPDSLRSWVLWWGRSLVPAWGALRHSVETGRSARAVLTNTVGYEHLANDAESAALFYRATVELARLSASAVLSAFDFSGLGRIVDVGGGYGELLVWVLRTNRSATGVLVELPQAIAGAREHLARAGVADRCTVVEGDFFAELPRGADVYLLASVLHNWTDDRAARILEVSRAAMGDQARLLVIEQLLPEASEPQAGRGLILADLTMLVAHGAGERTRSELVALLHAAGFAVVRTTPVGATSQLIEAVPRPRDVTAGAATSS
jgi:orsellinic acid C2-O-methyltransferase